MYELKKLILGLNDALKGMIPNQYILLDELVININSWKMKLNEVGSNHTENQINNETRSDGEQSIDDTNLRRNNDYNNDYNLIIIIMKMILVLRKTST